MLRKIIFFILLFIHASLVYSSGKGTVDVNFHGVNYSGVTFRFFVINPADRTSAAGGELINPYGAGGITCCAALPIRWHPGMKLEIKTVHWLKARPDGTRPEIREIHHVEVPRYASGKPGELWILRGPDGKISAVSSDYQPNHPNWPGRIKGWPVPSIEYRKEKWEVSRKHAEDGVNSAVELLKELEEEPIITAQKIWETEKEYDPISVADFSGPRDPRYLVAVKSRITQGLIQTKQRLQEIMEARP